MTRIISNAPTGGTLDLVHIAEELHNIVTVETIRPAARRRSPKLAVGASGAMLGAHDAMIAARARRRMCIACAAKSSRFAVSKTSSPCILMKKVKSAGSHPPSSFVGSHGARLACGGRIRPAQFFRKTGLPVASSTSCLQVLGYKAKSLSSSSVPQRVLESELEVSSSGGSAGAALSSGSLRQQADNPSQALPCRLVQCRV